MPMPGTQHPDRKVKNFFKMPPHQGAVNPTNTEELAADGRQRVAATGVGAAMTGFWRAAPQEILATIS